MEAFLIFLYLIPQCLLNILLCISRYNTACDVSYTMPHLIRFLLINVMLVCHCNVLFYCCCAF